MEKTVYSVGWLNEAAAGYKVPISLVTGANGFLFIAGLPPFSPKTLKLVRGDTLVQTRQVLENLKFAVEHVGSSMDKVVKTVFYSTNSAYFAEINEIFYEFFPKDPPVRTFVTVGSWPREFDVEIDAIALA
jgi:2-iminobutanoate/2-iminopropanoate deaminase